MEPEIPTNPKAALRAIFAVLADQMDATREVDTGEDYPDIFAAAIEDLRARSKAAGRDPVQDIWCWLACVHQFYEMMHRGQPAPPRIRRRRGKPPAPGK